MADNKIAIAAKVPAEWKEKIQSAADRDGLTVSGWLEALIGQALGIEPTKTPIGSRLDAIEQRVTAIETRLESLPTKRAMPQRAEGGRFTSTATIPEGTTCPHCGSDAVKRAGFSRAGGRTAQRFRCGTCGRYWQVG